MDKKNFLMSKRNFSLESENNLEIAALNPKPSTNTATTHTNSANTSTNAPLSPANPVNSIGTDLIKDKNTADSAPNTNEPYNTLEPKPDENNANPLPIESAPNTSQNTLAQHTQSTNETNMIESTRRADSVDSIIPTTTAPTNTAQTHNVYYAKYRLNIRQTPSMQSSIISRAGAGEALEVLEVQDEWSKVRSRFGVEGYVASYLLEKAQSVGEAYIVKSNALNVRLSADAQSAVIGRLSYNMRVFVLETQGEWGKIQLPNKQYGYISLNYLTKESQ